MIYHVTTAEQWQAAEQAGQYSHPSLASEGFIHCCSMEQLPGVLERYYQGKDGLLLLHINPQLLSSPLQYDLSPSLNQLFPHSYGAIPINAIVKISPL